MLGNKDKTSYVTLDFTGYAMRRAIRHAKILQEGIFERREAAPFAVLLHCPEFFSAISLRKQWTEQLVKSCAHTSDRGITQFWQEIMEGDEEDNGKSHQRSVTDPRVHLLNFTPGNCR